MTSGWIIIREQEAAGVCYLCANCSVDCPRLKSGVPQIKAERMGEWYWSTVKMQNLPRLYKIRKEPILDPGATVHQAAGASLWRCDTKKKPLRKRNKKVARNHGNMNWQGIRHNEMDVVNQAFGTNKVEIKHKSLEAIRLLRQADHVLEEIPKYIDDCTSYVWGQDGVLILEAVQEKHILIGSWQESKMFAWVSNTSQIWVRRVLWVISLDLIHVYKVQVLGI